MRYVLEVTIFMMIICLPAFVLVTLVVMLASFVYGDNIPQRDQDTGQEGRIMRSAHAEAPPSVPRHPENKDMIRIRW